MAEKTKKTERKNLRAMPSNVEAEQNVLGALLIDDKMADLIIPTLREEDFFVHHAGLPGVIRRGAVIFALQLFARAIGCRGHSALSGAALDLLHAEVV